VAWGLKDKNGKFRSRRSFKQDLRQDSNEPWEVRRAEKTVPSIVKTLKKIKNK